MYRKITPKINFVYLERQASFKGKKKLNKVSLSRASVLKQDLLTLSWFTKAKQMVFVRQIIHCLPIS